MSTQLSYLLIDAGNSRIKWALIEAQSGAQLAAGTFAHQASSAPVTKDFPQLASAPDWSSLATPASAWISNVAGSAARANLEILLETRWPGLPRHFITAQASQCGIVNRYRDPAQLGSDRWAALIGARAAYPGENLLLATFGTATTLEALHADGVFDGGLIVPGWSLMMQALGQRTAQLPELSPAEARALSGARAQNGQSSFARETAESMLDGCRLAQAALVEHAWQALGAQLNAPVRCVIGGGDAHLIAPALTIPFTHHDQLVLAGLALIAVAAP